MELALKNISIGYGRRTLLADANAVFPAGTLTAVTGRNGTGKSTLLRVMAGLAKPLAGEVIFRDSGRSAALSSEIARSFTPSKLPSQFPRQCCISTALTKNSAGLPPGELARIVGFVSTERIRVTNLKVGDLVALGRTPYTDWIGKLTPQDKAAVAEALQLVGMTGFAGKQMDTLSDGEAQRVMIARVLAQDTPVILLDEPTAFLDFHSRREVCELLAKLAHEKNKTIVFSSHELDLVRELADKIFNL